MASRNLTPNGRAFGFIEGQTNIPDGLDMTKQLKMREGQRSNLTKLSIPKSVIKASINQKQFKGK